MGTVILASTWQKTSATQMFQVPCLTCYTLINFSIYCKYKSMSINVSVMKKNKITGKMQTGLWHFAISTGRLLFWAYQKWNWELLDSVTHVITVLSLTLKRSRKTKCLTQEYWKDFSSKVLTVLKNKGAKVSGFHQVSVSISATSKRKN